VVAFAFGQFTVTSWGPTTPDGHVWRARNAERMVEFLADRDAPVEDLHRLGAAALDSLPESSA
jgi:hypothetical protein